MKLLLDTHVAIWALTTPSRLSGRARDLISDSGNQIHVSAVTIWEIAIKYPLGRADSPKFSGSEAIRFFLTAGFTFLDVTAAHAAATETLPPIHSDPFDRLLIAQALTEPMRLLTHDTLLKTYSPEIMGI